MRELTVSIISQNGDNQSKSKITELKELKQK